MAPCEYTGEEVDQKKSEEIAASCISSIFLFTKPKVFIKWPEMKNFGFSFRINAHSFHSIKLAILM